MDIVEHYEADIDLKNGSSVVDAKSLMEVLSFGIDKPLEMVVFEAAGDKLLDEIDFAL